MPDTNSYEVTLRDKKTADRRTLTFTAINFAEAELFTKILGNMTSDEQIIKIDMDYIPYVRSDA